MKKLAKGKWLLKLAPLRLRNYSSARFLSVAENFDANDRVLFKETNNFQTNSTKLTEISIDRSNLFGNELYSSESEETDCVASKDKEELSSLGKELALDIKLKGPITVHDFMAQAANHHLYGFYQKSGDDDYNKIGKHGDFTTAPEISQLFGEILAIWCVKMWEEQLRSNPIIHLVEMGPGNGTLMLDILRISQRFPSFHKAIKIHLIELSPKLRIQQSKRLQINTTDQEIKDGVEYFTNSGISIRWYSFFYQFLHETKTKEPLLVIGQEFLDAFPIHQFMYTDKGWREKLVDINSNSSRSSSKGDDSPYHFRMVLSSNATPAVKTLLQGDKKSLIIGSKPLPSTDASTTYKIGDGIEISPLAIATCEDVANAIQLRGGASIFIDYGEDYTQEDSLRAFRNHEQVHVLSMPGLSDVTADVNFSICAKIAQSKGVKVLPLQTQGEFLISMGIIERVEQIINADSTSEDDANAIVEQLKVLIDPQQMGKRFKVMQFIQSVKT